MPPRSLNREFAFILNDVSRMLRTYADQKGAQFGITRARWVVLARLDRFEGLKQSELAEMMDLQPISLTRLLDRLCESGLIERRPDPTDRRAKRLFLTAAARPLLEQRARRCGQEQPFGATVGRIGTALDQAGLAQAIEQPRQADGLKVHHLGQLGLLEALKTVEPGQHHPPRPGDAELRALLVRISPEHSAYVIENEREFSIQRTWGHFSPAYIKQV